MKAVLVVSMALVIMIEVYILKLLYGVADFRPLIDVFDGLFHTVVLFYGLCAGSIGMLVVLLRREIMDPHPQ